MGIFKIKSTGDWSKTKKFLDKAEKFDINAALHKYGQIGVEQLRNYTPKRTGRTAAAWRYEIETGKTSSKITFLNDNVNKGVNIAIILQYGHGTGHGGYVQGIDYINPALEPVFKDLADSAWKEVTS